MSNTPESAKRRRRTEDYNIEFNDDGYAIGWVFDLHTSFRDVLDIKYLEYVDREKTKALRMKLGRNTDEAGKPISVTRMAWTRGVPPIRRFERGHVFYTPHGPRKMVWGDAMKILQAIVQVDEAVQDDENGSGGWVRFTITEFRDGETIGQEKVKLSQEEFELFLRYGSVKVQ